MKMDLEMDIPLCVIIVFLVISFRNNIKNICYGINYFKRLYYGIPFVRPASHIKQLALELADIYKKYRYPIVGTNLFHIKSAIVIRDLELIKCVLVKEFDSFQDRGLFYNEIDDPLSAILGTVDHADWCCMKKKISPSFTPAKMKLIFSQVKNMCNELVRNLSEVTSRNGESIEIIALFSRFTIDAIGTIAFGKKCNEADARLFREMVMKAKQPYVKYPFNRFAVAFPKLARFLRMRKHSKEVTDFFLNYVYEIVKYRVEKNVRQDDFIQSWIDADLGVHRIAAVGFDLLSAGYADSTSTLAYCLYEMSLNKTIQDRAREEINEILENEELTYAVLQKMEYINQIIKEAERKYPVAGFATRIATKPYTFKTSDVNITIPCGMKIFIPIYGIHHDDNYFSKPEVFDPDRFTEESIRQRPQNAFLPFGAGPRKCVGSKFAEMIISLELVMLLKNFEFSTCPSTKIPIDFNKHKNTLHPEGGMTLKVCRI